MKHLLSITLIPLLFIFFSLDVNYTPEGGLVFDTNYTEKSISIISQYSSTQTISDADSSYLKRFGESRFYDTWLSSLKDNIDYLDEENDYTSVINTATNFYNLYKMLYPDSDKVSELGSYIQKGEDLTQAISTITGDTSNIINKYSNYLKGATVKVNGKFNNNEQYLYAKYMNLTYGYYLVTFTNIPNESFDGTIILAIPENTRIRIGDTYTSDIVLFNDTENDMDGKSYQCGISVDGTEYENQVSEYEDNLVDLYITLPTQIINLVRMM